MSLYLEIPIRTLPDKFQTKPEEAHKTLLSILQRNLYALVESKPSKEFAKLLLEPGMFSREIWGAEVSTEEMLRFSFREKGGWDAYSQALIGYWFSLLTAALGDLQDEAQAFYRGFVLLPPPESLEQLLGPVPIGQCFFAELEKRLYAIMTQPDGTTKLHYYDEVKEEKDLSAASRKILQALLAKRQSEDDLSRKLRQVIAPIDPAVPLRERLRPFDTSAMLSLRRSYLKRKGHIDELLNLGLWSMTVLPSKDLLGERRRYASIVIQDLKEHPKRDGLDPALLQTFYEASQRDKYFFPDLLGYVAEGAPDAIQEKILSLYIELIYTYKTRPRRNEILRSLPKIAPTFFPKLRAQLVAKMIFGERELKDWFNL